MNAIRARVRGALLAAGRGAVLSIASLAGSITLFVWTVLSIAFIPLGIGLVTTPYVLELVRKHANRRHCSRSPGPTSAFRSRTAPSRRICAPDSPGRWSGPRCC